MGGGEAQNIWSTSGKSMGGGELAKKSTEAKIAHHLMQNYSFFLLFYFILSMKYSVLRYL